MKAPKSILDYWVLFGELLASVLIIALFIVALLWFRSIAALPERNRIKALEERLATVETNMQVLFYRTDKPEYHTLPQ